MQKLLTFFSKYISIYAIFNDQSCFSGTLTNDIASFEQLGLDKFLVSLHWKATAQDTVFSAKVHALYIITTSGIKRIQKKIIIIRQKKKICVFRVTLPTLIFLVKTSNIFMFSQMKKNYINAKHSDKEYQATSVDPDQTASRERRGGSNEYPQFIVWAEIWKISELLSENFQFLVVKCST